MELKERNNEGKETGYSTFDGYGDVILYKPRGREGVTPIIHRAMYYVEEGQSSTAYHCWGPLYWLHAGLSRALRTGDYRRDRKIS